jgi:uncharacterized protein (DUF885 family)
MPARTLNDYENLLARLRAVPAYVDQNMEIHDESVTRGMTQSRVVVDVVVCGTDPSGQRQHTFARGVPSISI